MDFREKNRACFGSIGARVCCQSPTLPLYYEGKMMKTIFSPKLRVRITDNDNSPHGKFHRFSFPFSSKFSGLNFTSYVLYIYLCFVTCHTQWATQWAWVTYGPYCKLCQESINGAPGYGSSIYNLRASSLLAEAFFLVFADGRNFFLFSRQGTPGKEPLLAGKRASLLGHKLTEERTPCRFAVLSKGHLNTNTIKTKIHF